MQNMPSIIDIHCHTAGIGSRGSGCFVSSSLKNSWRYRVYLKAFGVNQQELEREGDAIIMQRLSEQLSGSRYVDAAVILAMDGIVGADGKLDRTASEIYIPNRFVAQETARHPNLLYGASINPYRHDALERLGRAVDDGAVLLKWLPSIQRIDPADDRLIPFYLYLKERELPLLTHTGNEESFTWAANELGDPERLRLPLSLGVTVIAAHSATIGRNGGERNFDRFLRLCVAYSNLYADFSALTQANRIGHLRMLLRQSNLHSRLLYGSDMPLISTGITSPLFHAHCLTPVKLKQVLTERNPWDRDVVFKRALGVTDEILSNTSHLLFRSSPPTLLP